MTSATEELERVADVCSRLKCSLSDLGSAARILEPVAALLGAQTAAFRAMVPGCEHPARLASLGIPPAVDEAYLDRYHVLDPGRRLLGHSLREPLFADSRRVGEWLRQSQLRSTAPDRASFRRYLREFLLPNGFHQTLGFGVQDDEGRMLLFNFHRGAHAADFGRLERARIRIVALYLHAQVASTTLAADLGGSAADESLSVRERDVASAVAAGLSNKEIAASLGISVRTVENHLRSIFAKLGVGTRTRLVATLRDKSPVAHRRRSVLS